MQTNALVTSMTHDNDMTFMLVVVSASFKQFIVQKQKKALLSTEIPKTYFETVIIVPMSLESQF